MVVEHLVRPVLASGSLKAVISSPHKGACGGFTLQHGGQVAHHGGRLGGQTGLAALEVGAHGRAAQPAGHTLQC